jgi:hypothetical protein
MKTHSAKIKAYAAAEEEVKILKFTGSRKK